MTFHFIAGKEDSGRLVKTFLRQKLKLSSTMLRRLKASGGISINGSMVYANYVLSSGDEVGVVFPQEQADFPAEDGELNILFEDDFLLAVNKPFGLITHPTHSRYNGTLANFALQHILISGGDGCHAVNRLDRDTSGIVLFAKSAYVKSLLHTSDYEKTYFAAVYGAPSSREGTVSLNIRRESELDMRRIVAEDGAAAVTHYTLLKSIDKISLLRLRLETGRTHQIRVHMLALGCPILGDRLYFTEDSRKISEELAVSHQLLHAGGLSFLHPVSGEKVDLRVLPCWPELAEFTPYFLF